MLHREALATRMRVDPDKVVPLLDEAASRAQLAAPQ